MAWVRISDIFGNPKIKSDKIDITLIGNVEFHNLTFYPDLDFTWVLSSADKKKMEVNVALYILSDP